MATPAVAAQRLRELAAKIKPNVLSLQRAAGLAIFQTLMTQTPVDTGRARANWLVGSGSAPAGAVAWPVPHGTHKDPLKPNPARKALIGIDAAAGEGVIAGHADGDLHITNNLPYIQALNDGHSAQAPAGFVELAVQEGNQRIKAAKLL